MAFGEPGTLHRAMICVPGGGGSRKGQTGAGRGWGCGGGGWLKHLLGRYLPWAGQAADGFWQNALWPPDVLGLARLSAKSYHLYQVPFRNLWHRVYFVLSIFIQVKDLCNDRHSWKLTYINLDKRSVLEKKNWWLPYRPKQVAKQRNMGL